MTDPSCSVLILASTAEDTAAAWVDGAPGFLREKGTELDVVRGAERLGVGSVELSVPFTRQDSDEDARSHAVAQSVGDHAAWVESAGSYDPSLAASEGLAAARVASLEAGACPEPVPTPETRFEDGRAGRSVRFDGSTDATLFQGVAHQRSVGAPSTTPRYLKEEPIWSTPAVLLSRFEDTGQGRFHTTLEPPRRRPRRAGGRLDRPPSAPHRRLWARLPRPLPGEDRGGAGRDVW
ncbi:MAG: hypothetical protein AVDCRST_MAG49-3317 [uncultured Thermomicrobiales bacterium]|uniref:Uncharacterized protein n=1 Tax=uncultured Thermomicrobiales bacterium TaxID=1645740 RepID=A0A6J4V547_9BACT|nr:MAG: hypothetical protein AVDCRST_MAG49-3317 [uncultured Thermomicrobiales bacterium]